MKKNKLPILMCVLVVLSIAAVVGYLYYAKAVSSPLSPTISFDSDTVTVSTSYTEEELLAGVTASDPEDGDVTDSLIVESISRFIGDGTARVTYVAFDSNNHMARAERSVRFTDYTSPKLELSAPLMFKKSGDIDILKYLSAEDCFDGDISGSIKYTLLGKSLTLSEVGEHRVQSRVTNSMGDTVHLTLKVEVTERDPNTAGITLTNYLIYLPQGADFDPAAYVEGYTAGGEKRTGADGLTIKNGADTSTEGVYTVDYIYGSGDGASRTRLIVVVE